MINKRLNESYNEIIVIYRFLKENLKIIFNYLKVSLKYSELKHLSNYKINLTKSSLVVVSEQELDLKIIMHFFL